MPWLQLLPLGGGDWNLDGGSHKAGRHLGSIFPSWWSRLASHSWGIMSLSEVVTEQVITAAGSVLKRGESRGGKLGLRVLWILT